MRYSFARFVQQLTFICRAETKHTDERLCAFRRMLGKLAICQFFAPCISVFCWSCRRAKDRQKPVSVRKRDETSYPHLAPALARARGATLFRNDVGR